MSKVCAIERWYIISLEAAQGKPTTQERPLATETCKGIRIKLKLVLISDNAVVWF